MSTLQNAAESDNGQLVSDTMSILELITRSMSLPWFMWHPATVKVSYEFRQDMRALLNIKTWNSDIDILDHCFVYFDYIYVAFKQYGFSLLFFLVRIPFYVS